MESRTDFGSIQPYPSLDKCEGNGAGFLDDYLANEADDNKPRGFKNV